MLLTKLRHRSKEKGFKNLLLYDERKLKPLRAEKKTLLTCAQIFEKVAIMGVKKDKRWRILCELGSRKNLPGNLL